jgi:hypothetical protein
MFDLNALATSGLDGATLREARGINNTGQIIANGSGPAGCGAHRLDPVIAAAIPALSREAMDGMALLLLASGFCLRRRHNQ